MGHDALVCVRSLNPSTYILKFKKDSEDKLVFLDYEIKRTSKTGYQGMLGLR